jgi:7-keto-8-aminopelargonate synthetase-like enzyme
MFTGGFNNKGAMTHKFNHNDINGLEIKLRRYRVAYPKALVCVAVEGIYRYVSDLVICRNILIYIQQYGRIRGTYSRYPCTQDDLQLHSAGQ